jgi:hypothetical protein
MKLVKLEESIVQMSFTPPSPMKATPTAIASNSNGVSTVSVSKAGDIMMISSSQIYLKKTLLGAKPLS